MQEQCRSMKRNDLLLYSEMSTKELDGKISSDKTFAYIKRQVPPETADRISALKLPGVHQEKNIVVITQREI